MKPTKGALEAEVANAVVRFHRDQQGRGPTDVRAHIVGEMVVVRSSGIFTPTETHLSSSDQGRKLIRSARQELRVIHREEIEGIVGGLLGSRVLRSYYDVDVDVAEQVEVYVLDMDIERKCRVM